MFNQSRHLLSFPNNKLYCSFWYLSLSLQLIHHDPRNELFSERSLLESDLPLLRFLPLLCFLLGRQKLCIMYHENCPTGGQNVMKLNKQDTDGTQWSNHQSVFCKSLEHQCWISNFPHGKCAVIQQQK